MRDAAKDPDIEDVLASVRRLVTAERRERPAAQSSALVLTPSQRVESDGASGRGPATPGGGGPAGVEEMQAGGTPEEARPPEGAGPDLADTGWKRDEPQDEFEQWSQARRAAAAAGGDAPEAEAPAESHVGGPAELSIEEILDAAEADSAKIAEAAMERDGGDANAPPVAFRHDPSPEIAETGGGADGPLFDMGEPEGEHADAGYAEVEDVDLGGVTDVDPDQVEDAEVIEPDPAAAPLAETDILDEEALRAMVAEIVRDELRGHLGERITSNVRKLVRREIHRILAARDFE